MKRRVGIVIVIILQCIFLAGCKNEGKFVNKPETLLVAESDEQADANNKPITFQVYIAEVDAAPDKNFQSPVAKKITELTGVTLEIENLVGESKQRISLMAASGDYPDLIFAKGELSLLMDVDGVEKLDDLIERYGQNIKKLYGNNLGRLIYSKEKPNIYCLGDQPVDNINYEPADGFMIQLAVLKELGYPELRTLEDYENVIKAYYEKHPVFKNPSGEIQPTIPMIFNGYDWGYFISISDPAAYAAGVAGDGEWAIDIHTYEAKRRIISDSHKQYFMWLNHMWNQELVDKESFTQELEQYKAKLASGRCLATIDAAWNIHYDVRPALTVAGMDDRYYARLPLTLDPHVKYNGKQDSGYMGGGSGMAITSKCKDKVRAIQFLDWYCTEEAQILINWGIEGEHYIYNENGKREFFPEVQKAKVEDKLFRTKTGIGKYTYPWPMYGNLHKDSTGNPYTTDNPVEIMKSYSKAEKEYMDAYNIQFWGDIYPPEEEFPVKPWGAAWKHEGTMDADWKAVNDKILSICKKNLPKIIMAEPDEFETTWTGFVKQMEANGVRELEAQFTQAIKDRIELWNSLKP